MSLVEQTLDGSLGAGRAALARGDWAQARACFAAALQGQETPEALEGLGLAAWGLNDTEKTFELRERAYGLYRQRDDPCGAARLAINLALDHFFFRGEYAVASGWLQRAHRLLEGLEDCAEHGWLAVTEALIIAWVEHDFLAVERLGTEAAVLGKALGDLDLEMLGLACKGLALVSQGKLAEGMRCLDEATLAAVSGEMKVADAACTVCCCLIFACEWARDFERAAQWVAQLRTLATRWSHPTQLYFCRTHYAGVLVWQGAWDEAERELISSVTELQASKPALAAEALVRLADLHCRQGRLEEAAALLRQAEVPPFRALVMHFCMLNRAALALAQDDAETAAELLERFLRAVPEDDRLERVTGLELLVQASVARSDAEGAARALAELRAVVTRVLTLPLQASLRFAEGVVAMSAEDYGAAKRALEDALDLYRRSGAPFEVALARLELARALAALGRAQPGERQAMKALQALRELGALSLVPQAEGLLKEIRKLMADGTKQSPMDLTPRELDVLRLIAAGKSNKDIASVLSLSVRTVERHISNIYTKIGVTGAVARAAATSYAHRNGLLSPSEA